jgi:HAD superfamily hydrolase (TIGR01490 family)
MSEFNKKYKYLAVFDLDRTIIQQDSSITLIKEGYKKGLLSKLKLITGFLYLFAHKMKLFPTKTVIKRISLWLKGIPEITIQTMAEDIFKTKLENSIYKGVLNEIEIHRKNNAGLIILSSSITAFCEIFKEKLYFDHAFSTNMQSKNGILTGQTSGEFCHGEEKLKRLKDFCFQNNCNLEEAYFYSDSIDDLPTLEAIGHPICVNPDKRLTYKAKINQWPILIWTN